MEVSFKLASRSSDKHVFVTILVARGSLEHIIIGYNVIEEVIKDQSDMASMRSSFPTVKQENITALLQFILSETDGDICSVKTTKNDITIPGGATIHISCRANSRTSRGSKIRVLFEPNPEQAWPTGLEIPDNLTSITSGNSSRVDIQVKNVTNHSIIMPGR
jgi:hypothetical protein